MLGKYVRAKDFRVVIHRKEEGGKLQVTTEEVWNLNSYSNL